MSAQEVRNEIIRENLPELIKHLTGFHNDDDNMRRCEQFGWSIIRNHRNLSTNSHEVRRKIEGIKEKFEVENFPEHAKHLEELCNEVVQHPICVKHYEVDIGWSLIDFLITLAYNPAAALRRNKYNIEEHRQTCQKHMQDTDTEKEQLKNLLKEDFIAPHEYSSSESELSDWTNDSDSDRDGDKNVASAINTSAIKDSSSDTSNYIVSSNLRPPEKEIPYKYFNNAASKEILHNSIQHSWWLMPYNRELVQIESNHIEANFASIYSDSLTDGSSNLVRFQPPSTATEYCLMRELLWMFHAPVKCKFFNVAENGDIVMQSNVSIPSVTVNSLSGFIKHNFLSYINMMQNLKKFIDSIYYADHSQPPPKTVECYASSLKLLLEPIWQELLNYEMNLLNERDFKINSLIDMKETLRDAFFKLENIYEVHQNIVFNPGQQNHPHVNSAYLLASLIHCNENAATPTRANVSAALFLASVKAFCVIIDTWWTEGRLDDWLNEFVVERNNSSDQSISLRKYCKDKEKSFFVPTHVSQRIMGCEFLRLLFEHSLEAGCTLNLLYEINHISDLRKRYSALDAKLYNAFIDDIMKHIIVLQDQLKSRAELEKEDRELETDALDSAYTCHVHSEHTVLDSLTTTDEFLLMTFAIRSEQILDECDAATNAVKSSKECSELNALDLFERFQHTKRTLLPFEQVVLSSLRHILQKRIAFANAFVVQLYHNEFHILKHFRNIRKVLLLEAGDLMHQFYQKLFHNIETGKYWANPFLLTTQLDDIICSKFPDMSSLFHIEIDSALHFQSKKAFEEVDALMVTYNFSGGMSHIINTHDIVEYNKVFRFLLKVKWGLMILENLQFPRAQRRRIPYAPYKMSDLLMRRLQQLRFWMLYAIQSIHFHLMTHVLQSMGMQLDEKITKCQNLNEMKTVHKSYVSTISDYCFLVSRFSSIKLGIEQILNLTLILRLEWNSCVQYIEQDGPLDVNIDDSINKDADKNYIANSQIEAIELTYIRCHQYLANKLNVEVYLKQQTFMLGLSTAFNSSLPH